MVLMLHLIVLDSTVLRRSLKRSLLQKNGERIVQKSEVKRINGNVTSLSAPCVWPFVRLGT